MNHLPSTFFCAFSSELEKVAKDKTNVSVPTVLGLGLLGAIIGSGAGLVAGTGMGAARAAMKSQYATGGGLRRMAKYYREVAEGGRMWGPAGARIGTVVGAIAGGKRGITQAEDVPV